MIFSKEHAEFAQKKEAQTLSANETRRIAQSNDASETVMRLRPEPVVVDMADETDTVEAIDPSLLVPVSVNAAARNKKRFKSGPVTPAPVSLSAPLPLGEARIAQKYQRPLDQINELNEPIQITRQMYGRCNMLFDRLMPNEAPGPSQALAAKEKAIAAKEKATAAEALIKAAEAIRMSRRRCEYERCFKGN